MAFAPLQVGSSFILCQAKQHSSGSHGNTKLEGKSCSFDPARLQRELHGARFTEASYVRYLTNWFRLADCVAGQERQCLLSLGTRYKE
jgi:hypothetical protein